ncbi:acetyl/propionyl/methylcrotonyl-CoA carboxylase subunit alpha [Sphingomonas sp. RG327]|uniref:propionyl-CoA carboxylase n=1 Tax=Sphingomonas anseongensis TaxID=2908207 RepID=A0ABT0RG78_9SPHN|nr:acetyl/propionyl/methylcrotonyl-CoA carboxylase subunit alpha [Sphingomonas anseongensis]MCL6679282.1 acetyl/propionyl/methylcrotonyl-CoA carboxylase subunit alpha [Sphingomonas anseongensis]
MFSKILIANRGEIACRVMRTAKRMGIKTVAVYSDADARAPHVLMADEAVRIGPPPASESYLKAELIIDACKATGAEAVHPGYGFLSERESFAKALKKAGITFIGPPPKAIAAMGDKIESKKLARDAGVNIVPGYLDDITTTKDALKIAKDIGYPVMMKASAGGGGKGMRLAWNETDVREGFDSVKREGLNSFGDDRVFIEKFIEQPRHIEIQVLGDQHGNVLYLGERECSIQRRHQKVVEEAPSPFVTPEMRRAMGEQAVALAKAVGYYSAGTVELIVSGADPTGKSFYFLEMNTRLQVEHPVTEEVTGLDLVEQMIRVAAGEKLAFSQDDVKLDGWAVETRVYAEDPYRGFLPSTGRLTRYTRPARADGDIRVRVDDGVTEGSEISMFYDPMVAKLITWGPNREAAIDAQIAALDAFELDGIGDNVDFLTALMQHPRYRSGDITTNFIAEEYPEGFTGAPANAELLSDIAVIGGMIGAISDERAAGVDHQLGPPVVPPSERVVIVDGDQHKVRIKPYEGGTLAVVNGGELIDVIARWSPGQRLLSASIDGRMRTVKVMKNGRGWTLNTRGASHRVQVLPPHVAELSKHMIEKPAPDLSRLLLAPMPGLLTKLDVAVGDKVEPGQPVAVMEAMKMENILRAPKAATVKATPAMAGDSLAVNQVIVEFE